MAEHDAAKFLGQRLDALLQRIALIRQADDRALGLAGLGDAPGNRAIVRDTQNDAAFALHEPRIVRHLRTSFEPGPGSAQPDPVSIRDRRGVMTHTPMAFKLRNQHNN
jgi:hypothetical protein